MDDFEENVDAVLDAIANVLGVDPGEISLDDVQKTENGLVLTVRHPDDAYYPDDFSELLQKELQETPAFKNIDVEEPCNFFEF